MIESCEFIHRDRFLLENGSHPSHAALILLSGEYVCEICGYKTALHSGDVLFFPRGERFNRKVISPIDAVLICFDRLPDCFCGRLYYAKDISPRQQSSVEMLVEAIRESKPQSIVEHFINDILICGERSDEIHDKNMLSCRQYIKDNCVADIDLNALAIKFGYTKQGLILKFKKCFGHTPMSFLIQTRIDTSKSLLLNTDYSISHISALCGYSNAYYFSNSFKKAVGMSPRQFREYNKI